MQLKNALLCVLLSLFDAFVGFRIILDGCWCVYGGTILKMLVAFGLQVFYAGTMFQKRSIQCGFFLLN